MGLGSIVGLILLLYIVGKIVIGLNEKFGGVTFKRKDKKNETNK